MKNTSANSLSALAYAFASALLFALGLVISGMTQPGKVIGFLNLSGLKQGISWSAERGFWDPSLAFVMGGAMAVTLLAFALTPKAGRKPWAASKFSLPTRTDIDGKLIGGSLLFGVGWALAGYCPGPALASILTGGADALVFVAAMVVGMVLAKQLLRKTAKVRAA